MWQINEKPISRYHILGVGIVIDHYQGNFIIEGFTANGLIKSLTSPAELEALSVAQEKTAEVSGAFNPQDIIDAREKILASIVRRRGQPQFRQKLITAYGGKCAITGCNATETLEAVHILPYRGPETNHLSNGLLLRADIHILFDLGLIAIDTSEMIVLISSRLNSTIYAQLAGKHIHIPEVDTYRPNIEVLNQHRAWADL
jgi:predicted restriction endonuclease